MEGHDGHRHLGPARSEQAAAQLRGVSVEARLALLGVAGVGFG